MAKLRVRLRGIDALREHAEGVQEVVRLFADATPTGAYAYHPVRKLMAILDTGELASGESLQTVRPWRYWRDPAGAHKAIRRLFSAELRARGLLT